MFRTAVLVEVQSPGKANAVRADEPPHKRIVEPRSQLLHSQRRVALVPVPAREPAAGGGAVRVSGGGTGVAVAVVAVGNPRLPGAVTQVPGAADPVLLEVEVRAVLPLGDTGGVDGVAGAVMEQPGTVAVEVLLGRVPVEAGLDPGAGAIVVGPVQLFAGVLAVDAPELAFAVPLVEVGVDRRPQRVPVLDLRRVKDALLARDPGRG